MNEEDCLREGQPAPDLATIKDFICYYIFSTQGMLSLQPTMSSVLNFAERFLPGSLVLQKTFLTRKTQKMFTM